MTLLPNNKWQKTDLQSQHHDIAEIYKVGHYIVYIPKKNKNKTYIYVCVFVYYEHANTTVPAGD